ncbi:MAG: hypothetical protein PHH70_00955 [Candidatus Gracilibacteria bacterium]|nr:hypothetical protein [Candidatus Gracilibacteria bacterium]
MRGKKRKYRRVVRKTVLIYCEGGSECAFLAYLNEIYYQRGGDFILTIENGQGGSPDILVKKTKESEGYDRKYVWLDVDRPEIGKARKIAEKAKIFLFENEPLHLEGELLRMLGCNIKGVSDYKRKFIQLYPNHDLCDKRTYKKLLPKEKIELIRESEEFVIGRIIKLLETGEL